MKRILLGSIAAIMGGAMLWWAFATTSRIRASATWPATDGEIVKSVIARDSSRIRGASYNHFYRADITYRFTVNGKAYESDVFTFGVPHTFSDSAGAATETGTYAVGRHVYVHYDPANPKVATINTGTVPEEFKFVVWPAWAFAIAGIVAVASGVISRRNRRRG